MTSVNSNRELIEYALNNDVRDNPDFDFLIREYFDTIGAEYSPKEAQNIENANVIIQHAKEVKGNLKDFSVGFFDSALHNTFKYLNIKQDPDSIQAVAAYNQIANTLRYAFYGKQVTTGEASTFAKAYGTLNQSYPAAMAHFSTALKGVKATIDNISKYKDPLFTAVMLGADQKELNSIIEGIDNMLYALYAVSDGRTGDSTLTRFGNEQIENDSNVPPGTTSFNPNPNNASVPRSLAEEQLDSAANPDQDLSKDMQSEARRLGLVP
jgi:hypothetical protein